MPLRVINYNRANALNYVHKWAYSRNPEYLNFDKMGGDCTNFVSQALYAGGLPMNFAPTFGWYYKNGNNKSPSWSGVEYLYRFLTTNKGIGPFGQVVDMQNVIVGDIIQLCFDEKLGFEHSLFVVSVGSPITKDTILVACHTYDRDYFKLSDIQFVNCRTIHILGARV